ncbi:MAG: GNAT family N-acetyltransferase [Pirellulales bacterium]|nr:GNAT family N-acetyltransferase [Pirellulales bacterium]
MPTLLETPLPPNSLHFADMGGMISTADILAEQAAQGWSVNEIRTLPELLQLRPAWNRLAGQTAGATHFLTLDWLATYWRHFGQDQQLRILVVATQPQLDGGATKASLPAAATIVGVLPMVLRHEQTALGLIRVLTFPLDGWGCFYGPLGPCPDLTLSHGLKYLRAQSRDYDLLDLRWIDNRQGLGDLCQTMLRSHGFSAVERVWFPTAQVDLTTGWDEYWARRTSHWRTNVRSNLKKLAKLGRLGYLRYRPRGEEFHEQDPRWDLFEQCVDLAAHSWQGSRADGTTLSHPQVREYLRDAHQTAARTGALDLNLLYCDGQPVAFAYNYAQFGQVYGLRSGYDPKYKAQGAGTCLIYHMLEDSCRRGDNGLDLGPNNLTSKQPWLTSVVPSYRYSHFTGRSLYGWLQWLRWRTG